MSKYKTKEAVLTRGKEAIGLTFGEIDKTGRIKTGKGSFGNIIEESWFDKIPDNKPEPDFEEAGVELKVTPYKKNIRGKNKYSAKERLVLNIIDYMEEYKNEFETSHFWYKNQSLLLMFYENIDGVPRKDFKINYAVLYEYPEEDLKIIKDDWEKIISYIRDGKAHELSEGLTTYLGACTKGATAATSYREQPQSELPAKQRAFSLKQSYMTYLLNSFIVGPETDESIIKNPDELKGSTFEDYILTKLNKYIGKNQNELMDMFGLQKGIDGKVSKNINQILVSRMLDYSGKISNSPEFQKANIEVKTIRVEGTKIIECMSFPAFKFTELIKEEWETSTLRNKFEETKYLFAIFKFNVNQDLIFIGAKFWTMPVSILDNEVKSVWEKTVKTIKEGVVLKPVVWKSGKIIVKNNLPKSSENMVAHVRPHGKDGNDTYPLPDGRLMTKQCFWLNNSFVYTQIKDILE